MSAERVQDHLKQRGLENRITVHQETILPDEN